VSEDTIGATLVQDDGDQQPVYFARRVIQGAKSRYQLIEKVVFALIYVARRL